jgi:lysyl-tRNA synthetase class I
MEHSGEDGSPDDESHAKDQKKLKRTWRQRFRATSAHNQASIVFSALIMLATICYSIIAGIQLRVMRKASDDSATQTQRLIEAAKRNAAAAEHFSDSAKLINGGVGDAVKKLEAQAEAIEAARQSSQEASNKALQASIDNFHADQRAWLGASDNTYNLAESGPISSSVSVLNTGKSPALDIYCLITEA